MLSIEFIVAGAFVPRSKTLFCGQPRVSQDFADPSLHGAGPGLMVRRYHEAGKVSPEAPLERGVRVVEDPVRHASAILMLAWFVMVPSTGFVDDRIEQDPAAVTPQRRGWQADPRRIEDLRRRKLPWNYLESEVPGYRLPDPLVCEDGTRISSREGWERKRRPE